MSRTVVRYEGEGKARRPIYADHGPANGAGGLMTMGAHAQVARIAQADASELVEVGGRMPDGGAGVIERSIATEAQREAWRAADAVSPAQTLTVSPGLQRGMHIVRPARSTTADIQRSRMRGAARHVEVITGRRPHPAPSPESEEEPVMAIEPRTVAAEDPIASREPLGTSLQVVADAAAAAAVAWTVLQGASHAVEAADAELAEAEVAWDRARDALEASWRSTGIGLIPPLADRIASMYGAAAEATIDAKPSANILEIIPGEPSGPVEAKPESNVASGESASTAGGGPDQLELPRGQREILAAVTRHAGDRRKAAADLGRSVSVVEMQLEYIGKKGLLPIDLIAKLPARFAKYSPAVR